MGSAILLEIEKLDADMKQLTSKFRSLRGSNQSLVGPWTLTMEAWRFKMEPWWIHVPVIANSFHFEVQGSHSDSH
jgi:hypothetical protein